MTCASFHILDPCRILINIGKPEKQKPKKVRTREINTATKVVLVFLITFFSATNMGIEIELPI